MKSMIKRWWPVAVMAVGLTLLFSEMTGLAFAEPDAQVQSDASQVDSGPAAKVGDKPGAKGGAGSVEQVKSFWDAFKGGKYREGISGVIVLLMFLWREYAGKFIIGKLSTYQVGLVTVIIGFVGTIPEALTMEPFDWKVFVWSGLLTSAQAMLVWKTIGQKVLPLLPKLLRKKAKPEAPA